MCGKVLTLTSARQLCNKKFWIWLYINHSCEHNNYFFSYHSLPGIHDISHNWNITRVAASRKKEKQCWCSVSHQPLTNFNKENQRSQLLKRKILKISLMFKFPMCTQFEQAIKSWSKYLWLTNDNTVLSLASKQNLMRKELRRKQKSGLDKQIFYLLLQTSTNYDIYN